MGTVCATHHLSPNDTGDLQKQVPVLMELHACLAQGSEELKEEIPQDLQELQAQLCSPPAGGLED